ncbi:unnamed protein product, partial [Scytosiphon promiscuus]
MGSVTSRVPLELPDAGRGACRYVRLLDVDSDGLLRAVLEACDRVGSYRVVGWCKRRWLMDVLFDFRRDAVAAVDDIEHLFLKSTRLGRPIKILLKPAGFVDASYSAASLITGAGVSSSPAAAAVTLSPVGRKPPSLTSSAPRPPSPTAAATETAPAPDHGQGRAGGSSKGASPCGAWQP